MNSHLLRHASLVTLIALGLGTTACYGGDDADTTSGTTTDAGGGGAGGAGGAGGGAQSGGNGGQGPVYQDIPLPFLDDFESYGVSTVTPFGDWQGDGVGVIVVDLDNDGYETQALDAGDRVVLPGKFGDLRLSTDVVIPGYGQSVHVQVHSEVDGHLGYELVIGGNYGQTDFALYKETEAYTKKIAAPPSISGASGWAHLRMLLVGGALSVYLDGNLLAQVTDDDHPILEGAVAIVGRFDNFKLTQPAQL